MERNDYTQQALRTWIDSHPEEVQIVHACGAIMCEWKELKQAWDSRHRDGGEDAIDELGDVTYHVTVLQHLTCGSHMPDANKFDRVRWSAGDALIAEALDVAVDILRSTELEHYDREALDKRMKTLALQLGDCMGPIAKALGVSLDTVLARNIRKLTDRHGEG